MKHLILMALMFSSSANATIQHADFVEFVDVIYCQPIVEAYNDESIPDSKAHELEERLYQLLLEVDGPNADIQDYCE